MCRDRESLRSDFGPGGDEQPTRIAQTFLNVIDFGMNIQEAIEAPRWSTTSFPASKFPHTIIPGTSRSKTAFWSQCARPVRWSRSPRR